jgi:glyoxylase-like metal-dependent hydrolase (beta-lactamase superfamily II)
MLVHTLTLGPFETNCYMVHREGDARALVIDPGEDVDAILDFLDRKKLQVVGYPVTHGHVDHVSGLARMFTARPAPIGMHPKDQSWAFKPINNMLPFYETPEAPGKIERNYAEGQVWEDAGLKYRILETPGHAPGAVGLYFEDEGVLFPGDTLFQGSVGRTDLLGGDMDQLMKSLPRLMELPDKTIVYPGHGPKTTIGIERKTNPFLQ